MIDISNGLLQDLGHICKASHVGAIVKEENLPLSPAYRSLTGHDGTDHALAGGEDYELLFCARRRDRLRIEKLEKFVDVPISRIGTCVHPRNGITVLNRKGDFMAIRGGGHDHFKH